MSSIKSHKFWENWEISYLQREQGSKCNTFNSDILYMYAKSFWACLILNCCNYFRDYKSRNLLENQNEYFDQKVAIVIVKIMLTIWMRRLLATFRLAWHFTLLSCKMLFTMTSNTSGKTERIMHINKTFSFFLVSPCLSYSQIETVIPPLHKMGWKTKGWQLRPVNNKKVVTRVKCRLCCKTINL